MTTATTINVREYTRYPYKYLKQGEYVVTKDSVPTFKVVVTDLKNPTDTTPKVVTPIKDAFVTCLHTGCSRDGSYYRGYCMEHWRETEPSYE